MKRDDHATLVALGLSEEDMRERGLSSPADAPPERLVDVYIRRSKKSEDLATLRGHLRDIVRWVRAQPGDLQIRHVWFEQLSASKSYVRRVEFEKCTAAVLEGKSRTMAVWKTDRFDRRGMGQVGLMLDRLDRKRARLVCVVESLDSSQTGARILFAFLSEKARDEAKDIALRVTNGHQSHRVEGHRGTGQPPFGTLSPRLENGKPSGKVEPNPEEYETARRLADCLLGTALDLPEPWNAKEGQPLSAHETAHVLNAEGRRTRRGNAWSATTVSTLAQSPMWAGMIPVRERKRDEDGNPLGIWTGYGEPFAGPDGQPIMCGTGVVTPGEWYKIRALIQSRSQAGRKGRGKPAAKYLGTGFFRCGRMRDKGGPDLEMCLGSMTHRGGNYRCHIRVGMGLSVCAGCTTMAERADAALGEAWVSHVTALEPGDPVLLTIGRRWLAFSDPETQAKKELAQGALADAQNRVQRLEEDYYVHGKISEARYEELSAAQRATITIMGNTLDEINEESDVSALMDVEELRASWMSADLATRRMLLRCTLGPNGVVVAPALESGSRQPILNRLEFDWISA